MKKPVALLELLEELKAEISTSSVRSDNGSKAYIYMDANAVAAEDSIMLNRIECGLLFDSKESVDLLLEALGRPKHATIEFHQLEMSPAVLDTLEREFEAVHEI